MDLRKTWDLEKDDWMYDEIPEIMDGKNVYDYIDPDIAARLDELEDEEEERLARLEIEEARRPPQYTMEDSTLEAVGFIKDKIKVLKMERAMRNPAIRRTRQQAISVEKFNKRTGSQDARGAREAREDVGQKRGRSRSTSAHEALAADRSRSSSHVSTKTSRSLSGRSESRDRTMSVGRSEGYKDVNQKLRAVKLSKVQTRSRSRACKMGEGDRTVINLMPKHLYTGKVKSNGKRDRR